MKQILEEAINHKRLRYVSGKTGSHVKAGYYAFDDTNVDPSMREAINRGEVVIDENSRKMANSAVSQELEDDL